MKGRNLEGSATCIVEGIHGIFNNLDKGLEQLFCIAQNRGQSTLYVEPNHNFPGLTARFQKLDGAAQQSRKIDGSLIARRLLCKAQKICDEIPSSSGLLDNFAHQN